jgi:hypothetical protein
MITVQTNETFQAVVSITNVGNTTWTSNKGYSLILDGDDIWSVKTVPLPYDVPPNTTVSFTFNATAPSIGGLYSFNWGIAKNGVLFGKIYCAQNIQVIGLPTQTPTATPTYTPTSTSKIINIPTPTPTPTLQVSQTPFATPTQTPLRPPRITPTPTPIPSNSPLLPTPFPTQSVSIPAPTKTPTPSSPSSSITSNLIAYYKFDNPYNYFDSSCNHYDLSPVNPSDLPSFQKGYINEDIVLNNGQVLKNASFPYIPQITVAAWVKLNSTYSGGVTTNTSNRSLFSYNINGINEYDFGFTPDGYTYISNTGISSYHNFEPSINDQSWHFVAWQVDTINGSMRYLVDGNVGASVPCQRNSITNSLHLVQIGLGGFQGQIDEMAIWSKILTDTELDQYANNTSSVQTCFTSTPTPTPTVTPTLTPTPTKAEYDYTLIIPSGEYQNLDLGNFLFLQANASTRIAPNLPFNWDGRIKLNLQVIIQPNANIISTDATKYAFYVANGSGGFILPTGSKISIINNGNIQGAGGIHSDHGTNTANLNGGNGGSAMYVNTLIYLVNNGTIYGGGGAGGTAATVDVVATVSQNGTSNPCGGGGGSLYYNGGTIISSGISPEGENCSEYPGNNNTCNPASDGPLCDGSTASPTRPSYTCFSGCGIKQCYCCNFTTCTTMNTYKYINAVGGCGGNGAGWSSVNGAPFLQSYGVVGQASTNSDYAGNGGNGGNWGIAGNSFYGSGAGGIGGRGGHCIVGIEFVNYDGLNSRGTTAGTNA